MAKTLSFLSASLLVVTAIVCLTFLLWLPERQRLKRAEFIRTYRWPKGLLERLEAKHPGLTRKHTALVSRGLRQFFIAYLMSGRKFVSMPSQIADDLWHEFILYTREYDAFCRSAFGQFFHHGPAATMTKERRDSNEGLRRVWWFTCKYENIDPINPTRLPLLFALDAKLNVPNGFRYDLNCAALRKAGDPNVYCAADFADTSFDGTTTGLGDGGHGTHGDATPGHASGHTGVGGCSGGGCGGGCGGGGD